MAAPSHSAAFQLFRSVVKRVLSNWTALQLAVEHGMGGPDGARKALWMEDAVADYFRLNADLERDEVEDMLEDVLGHEFDTVADDGSVKQIADLLCATFGMCERGETERVEESMPTPRHEGPSRREALPRRERAEEPMDEDREDEEGWTVVRRSNA